MLAFLTMRCILLRCFLVCVIALHFLPKCSAVLPSVWQEYASSVGSARRLVLHFTRLGLANRLRTIADWHSIAMQSNRELVVVWEVTRDCQVKFHSLFIGHPNGLTVIDNDTGTGSIAEVAQSLRDRNTPYLLIDNEENIWAPGQTSFFLSAAVAQSSVQVLLTSYDGVISLEATNCLEYLTQHAAFLSQLRPKEDVRIAAENIYNTYFVNFTMVGVHYRAHDPTQDWAVIPPLLGDETDKVFGEGASVEDFVKQMQRIERTFAARLDEHAASQNIEDSVDSASTTVVSADSNTDGSGGMNTMISTTAATTTTTNSSSQPRTRNHPVRFFVASNNAEAKAALCQQFPSAIYLGGEHRRDSAMGMQLALLEWILLTKAELVLHTYGSTFAEQAALVHLRPLVGIWEGHLVHHSSKELPFCGDQQYARALGNARRTAKYTTGVNTDNTEVEGVFLPLVPTNGLQEWGLTDVYCLGEDTGA